MKRAVPRLAVERISDLEERQESLGERLEKIENKVDAIHELLIGAKAVLWLATKIVGTTGALLAIATALIVIYKFAVGR